MGTKYHERCVCNSPEFMPLENSLNYDLKLSHRYHCAITAHPNENDPRKDPLKISRRIADGVKKYGNIQKDYKPYEFCLR